MAVGSVAPALPGGAFVQERIEDKRVLLAPGRRRGGIAVGGGQDAAGRSAGFGLALGRRRDIGRGGGRRQVERPLAAAAGKRQRRQAQDNDGPPRAGRAKL